MSIEQIMNINILNYFQNGFGIKCNEIIYPLLDFGA